ncbi:site-specific integrase [Chryseobacterium fistulae]|uniref:Tyrosine recombinase XerC n=1 Tax=Chryseobacterium fistulae TaxID=2675058 RepID=A0A6N4XTK6_9FLAO|nr:site-specific integrase [Chryseobacterium fistulae]CAA7386969.1 Tyrosine recombinase XerC [Chryseobacterium fistulae]
MKIAEASIYLDELRPKKNGACSVKIKVTFNRKRKYFSTGLNLTPDEFEKVINNKRRTSEQKELFIKVNHLLNKANNVIQNLAVFTFGFFEENFLEQRNIQNSVSFAFDKYIEQLKIENRLGTAVSYECAKNSIEDFKKNLTFAEITPALLKKYENRMLQNNKSISTIGIYLRSLRAIYNLQNIDKSLYPFGEAKNKYSIPTGRNIKKALTVEEIGKIYHYEAKVKSTKEMAKDYWLFLYLCNGMNVKDFCLLKWGNIDGQMLTYTRAKTQRSKKESKPISVALKSETWEIIKKWGQPSVSKEAHIFPHLQLGMTPEKERMIYKQLTKIINKYMNQIVSEIGINKNVTTYFARHSFATVLKRSGAKIEMISELLGHSSVDVTESYLDSFEKEHIQRETDVLTIGFTKTN